MRVLVLNRFGLSSIRYADWLDSHNDIAMITSSRSLSGDAEIRREQTHGFAEVVALDDYVDNPFVEYEAAQLHHKYCFNRIIAMSEYDILRGARLRELLGIPGQGVQAALAFRDKVEMKRLLMLSGIPVARHKSVHALTDVLAFVMEHGYPVLLKPRRGAGSVGIEVIRDESELRSTVANIPAFRGDHDAGLIVEEYIENELYQVDGVMCNGRVELCWPSHSTTTLAYRNGGVQVTTMLDPNDPLRVPLQEMAESALLGLPSPPVTIFHIEIFLNNERGLVMNEVAGRMAGGKTDANMVRGFGVNLEEWYLRSVLPERSHGIPTTVPKVACAAALFSPRRGVLVSAPTPCPIEGVVDYGLTKSIGDRLEAPTSNVDFMAWLTASASNRSEVQSVIDRGVQWVTESVQIDQQV